MESIAEVLKQSKLLRNTPVEVIEHCIVPAGTLQTYGKDTYLIMADQVVDTIKILIQGKVNVVYYYADGSYSLTGTEQPPQVLALNLIATKSGISPYYALAAEPTTVFSFPASVVFQPGTLPEVERQGIVNQFLVMLSHLQVQKEKHIMILSRSGLRDRIMVYLSLQAQRKRTHSFSIRFSREELAAYLCVNRSALSHELSRMKQEGLIDFHKNCFTLLKYDPKTLP